MPHTVDPVDSVPSIILVRPQMGENIGAAARAMLNFGLTDLRLVAPRDGWPSRRAADMASGAFDRFTPQLYDDLASAVADRQMVMATTARRRDMVKPVYSANSAMTKLTSRTALVFGPERTGLENEDLALCHALITIPVNPDFPSINLAQAVLLLGYEYRRHYHETPPDHLPLGDSEPASQKDMEDFMRRLEAELEAGHFYRDANLKPTMQRNIRNLFMRGHPTAQEIKTLHGVVSALIGNKKRRL